MCASIVASNRRLFPPDPVFAAATAAKLPAIVDLCRGWPDNTGIEQGYTYLGQFLAHEITSRELPRLPVIPRTRYLDFDSLYGAGAHFDACGRFRYTEAAGSLARDLLRDRTTKLALIPDFRNDEQPIISQLHLTFQLFHNTVIDALIASPQGSKLSQDGLFPTAKSYVVATLQRIYAVDYLAKLTVPSIHGDFLANRLAHIDIPRSEPQLPVEITHAALRFGHSQVRDTYLLNDSSDFTDLVEMFSLTGNECSERFKGLPRDKRVDWRRFFEWGEGWEGIGFDPGQRINPGIVCRMLRLSDPLALSIVERNVSAAVRAALPSGQSVASRMHQMDPRVEPQLRLNSSDELQEAKLREYGLWEHTPLWLFILIEASAQESHGKHLGPLGSIFLCETVRSALAGQPDYRSVHADYEREFGLPQIEQFVNLVKFTDPKTYNKRLLTFKSLKNFIVRLARRQHVE